MKVTTILIWLALAVYIGSFFLIAVKDPTNGSGLLGYSCALTALTAPWGSDGLKELRQEPVEFFSILFSGWINPIFLITLLARWLRPASRVGRILTALLFIMFPACWIVFVKAHVRPSVGYFVWTAAMVVAVISAGSAGNGRRSAAANAA